ncbi:MAG: extracellular solute-binding protein family 3 [Deltaproteobacteria bacterium]|nr:extracellular solute-binding protein family 3 [Deltaproteobacteria bacterium]
MRMINAVIALMLTLILCTAAFAQDKTGPGADRSLDEIKKRGIILVGIDDAFPPMAFRDAVTKEIIGLDIDLARRAAQILGLTIEFKPIPWDRTIPRLNTGDVDVVWSGLSILPERENQMLFSQPYLESRQVIVVRKGSNITRKSDLKQKMIGFQRGASSEKWIGSDPEVINALKDLGAYRNNQLALKDLEAGLIDAVVMDEVIARYTITKRPDVFVMLGNNFGKELYGVGFRKNDIALRNAIDKVLAEMKKDGTIDRAAQKWLGDKKP